MVGKNASYSVCKRAYIPSLQHIFLLLISDSSGEATQHFATTFTCTSHLVKSMVMSKISNNNHKHQVRKHWSKRLDRASAEWSYTKLTFSITILTPKGRTGIQMHTNRSHGNDSDGRWIELRHQTLWNITCPLPPPNNVSDSSLTWSVLISLVSKWKFVWSDVLRNESSSLKDKSRWHWNALLWVKGRAGTWKESILRKDSYYEIQIKISYFLPKN